MFSVHLKLHSLTNVFLIWRGSSNKGERRSVEAATVHESSVSHLLYINYILMFKNQALQILYHDLWCNDTVKGQCAGIVYPNAAI